jgi:hypothetical protein
LDYNCIHPNDYYEWDMIYEFRVPNLGVAPEDCGTLAVSNSHNSPSKDVQNSPGLGRIGNYVWLDSDCDGCQETEGGDTCDENLCNCGMAGVCMCLFQLQADDTWARVATTHTDRCGEYWFNYLEAGTYYVDPGAACVGSGYCHTLGEFTGDNGSMTDPDDGPPSIALCPGFGTSQRGEPVVLSSGGFLSGSGFVTGDVGDTIVLPPGGEIPYADYGYDNSPTAVELRWFDATGGEGAVTLGWETVMEIDNLGFNLYRAEGVLDPRTQINEQLIPSRVPPGTPFGAVYEYVDCDVVPGGQYYYWLEDVDIYGYSGLHGPVDAQVDGPTMHAGPIEMTYQTRGQKYSVSARTAVLDAGGEPVAEATVSVRWILPDSSVQDQQAESDAQGSVTFAVTDTQNGTYEFCVTDVAKEGWVYDAEQNVETCDSMAVP